MVYFNNKPLFPDDVFRGDKFTVDSYPGDIFTVTDSMQSNNGNFRANDQNGKLVWFNTVSDDIDIIEKANIPNDYRKELEEVQRKANGIQPYMHYQCAGAIMFHDEYDDYALDRLDDMCLGDGEF